MNAVDRPNVIVVDDDLSVREGLDSLLRSVGLDVRLYGSVADFLAAGLGEGPCCLVLDVRLPGQSGLDLQADLVKLGVRLPIIFISGHGDIPMTVLAMKAGAVEFLVKPFREQDLLNAINIGLELDRLRRAQERTNTILRQRYNDLTPREQEIMTLVVTGRINKQIAHGIGVSEITVKIHRSHVMRKMGAHSFADLVRMADNLYPSTATWEI